MFKDFLGLSFILFLGFLAVMIPVNFINKYQCDNYQDITSITTRWVAFDACYIKTDKGWQRWDEYKARVTANNLKD